MVSNFYRRIKHHKQLLLGLVVVQALLLVVVIVVTLHYQVRILQNVQAIMDPLQSINYNPTALQDGAPLLKEGLVLYQSLQSLQRNFFFLLVSILISYILLGGVLWWGSHSIWKDSVKSFFWRFGSSMLLLIGVVVGFYFILKNSILQGVDQSLFKYVLYIILVCFALLYYALLVAWALPPTTNWKSFLQWEYIVALQKIYKTLPLLVLLLSIAFLPLYGIYWSTLQQGRFILLVLCTLLFPLLLVLTRIYWIAFIRELTHEKSAH